MSAWDDAEREARAQLAEFDRAWQEARKPYIDRLIYIAERNPKPLCITVAEAIQAGIIDRATVNPMSTSE